MSDEIRQNIIVDSISFGEYPIVSLLVNLPCQEDPRPYEVSIRVPSPSSSSDENIAQAKQLLLMSLEMLIKELKNP